MQPSSSDGGLTTAAQFSALATSSRLRIRPGLDQLLGLAAVVEHGGAHRVAAGDAADHDRPRDVAGAGDGAVDPVVAGGVERLGELGDRRRLAARRPPVGDLEVGGVRHADAAAPRTPRAPRPAMRISLRTSQFYIVAVKCYGSAAPEGNGGNRPSGQCESRSRGPGRDAAARRS